MQMFEAIEKNEGPYASFREQVSAVKSQVESQQGDRYLHTDIPDMPIVPVAGSSSDVENCPECHQQIQQRSLLGHLTGCSRRIVSSSKTPLEVPASSSPDSKSRRVSSPPYSSTPEPGLSPTGIPKFLPQTPVTFQKTPPPKIRRQTFDMDDASHSSQILDQARNPQTRNFLLCLHEVSTSIAFDIDPSEDLYGVRPYPTRWINTWGPNRQRQLITGLGQRYDISPRLLDTILQEKPHYEWDPIESQWRSPNHLYKGTTLKVDDHEKDLADRDLSRYTDHASHHAPVNCPSVSIGERFVCIGYDWIHNTHETYEWGGDSDPLVEDRTIISVRVWCWLILCNDGTVISIYQDIHLPRQAVLFEPRNPINDITRRRSLEMLKLYFGDMADVRRREYDRHQ